MSAAPLPASPQPSPPWHALDAALAAEHLRVEPTVGLDTGEVAALRARWGPNTLPEKPPPSAWRVFAAQWKSALIWVLAGAAGLAAVIGHPKDAAVIMVVVFLNAVLGFVHERRATRSLTALRAILSARAIVRRGGARAEVEASEVVPGDVLLVSAGERIAADGRLWTAHDFEVDEAMLTGESLPVRKRADVVHETSLGVQERENVVYNGTLVTRGRAEVLVTDTGPRTRVGSVAAMTEAVEERKTPLTEQLDTLGRRLAWIALGVVALVVGLELMRGASWGDSLLIAIALAVGAIPEGLPAVVTVTLALGMHRMAGHGAIVKHLASVETLGCTTVICSDKTGTLTLNQMTVRAIRISGVSLEVTGEGYAPAGEVRGDVPLARGLVEAAVLANDARLVDGAVLGDPMEGALLVLGEKCGSPRAALTATYPRIAELPFDASHKRMATFHRVANGDAGAADAGEVVIFVKGAPEAVLPSCTHVRSESGRVVPMDAGALAQANADNEALAGAAMRVLATACRRVSLAQLPWNPETEDVPDPEVLAPLVDGLTYLGVVGLVDPPRPEAALAIQRCQHAGIAVKMVTGDQRATAVSIADALGLHGDALTGAEIDAMDDGTLTARARTTAVFARVLPEHKMRLVEALRQGGEVVAMTGDGVNDAPALRAAHIGVAMGKGGTDVSRQAASMVLTDDRFDTIVRAVEEGRTIYANLISFVRLQLSTNIGAVLTVLAAPILGLPLPLHPVQILFVNLVGDGPPGLALAMDPARPGLMDERPRDPRAQLLTPRELIRLSLVGLVMAVGTLGLLAWADGAGRTAGEASTLAFTTFVFFQLFNVLAARSVGRSVFGRHTLRNGRLWLALLGVSAVQVLVVVWPGAHDVMHTTSLRPGDWGLALGVASSIVLLRELSLGAVRMFRARG